MKRLIAATIAAGLGVLSLTGVAYAQDLLVVNSCDAEPLAGIERHDGFQEGNRCVAVDMGAVTPAAQNPSLLITDAPDQIKSGRDFQLQVSTRNLVRDFFPPAGQGGYYLNSAFLNDEGLTRGHFHVACRVLNGNRAQDPAPAPAFFQAVEDGGGGARPDTVRITVPGQTGGRATFPRGSEVQCSAWAGDASHRTPMMERANQTPAFDSVKLRVTGNDRDRDRRDFRGDKRR